MRTLVVLAAFLIACGPGSERSDGGNGSGSGSGSGSGNSQGCSDAAKLVYVVDSSNKFSKFDPSTKTFTDLGTLSCPGTGLLDQPFSMGVDRNAIAWVLYSPSGKLYRVDTANNLACTASNWQPATNGLQLFGMGFSSNTAGSTDDTLFVAGGTGDPMSSPTSKLATLDTTAFTSGSVGTVTGWPELTGNGNAELWGWFPDASSPRVEQINKTSGAAVAGKTYNLPSLAGQPMAWAFAFWGGDYWIFLERSTDSSTTVYQIDGTAGTVKGMTAASGREIVGAGVSTCAPVVIL
ncbi:MAG TPA: hypothetical protein VLB44_06210 [Kofleriaceae bacterium]|nr:hypothetical protein [Kofleriaceae bacterium]